MRGRPGLLRTVLEAQASDPPNCTLGWELKHGAWLLVFWCGGHSMPPCGTDADVARVCRLTSVGAESWSVADGFRWLVAHSEEQNNIKTSGGGLRAGDAGAHPLRRHLPPAAL